MTSWTARRRILGAVAVVAALVALSACADATEGDGVASAGGQPNPATPAETEDGAPLDEDTQALAFAGCMRDNGVDMPDPGPGQEGLAEAFQAIAEDYGRETMDRAMAACEDLMPQYSSEEEHSEDVMLDLAECLRDQGLDVSDQPFDDAHAGDVDVGEFSAAMEECRDVLIRGGQ
jgi:hypothetical protein